MSSPAACCGLDNDVHLCSLLQNNAVGLPYRVFYRMQDHMLQVKNRTHGHLAAS